MSKPSNPADSAPGTKKRPVRPKESSSLIILRRNGNALKVLMGQRGAKAVFGGAYVFPGGKVDRSDRHAQPVDRLDPRTIQSIARTEETAQAFGMAAVRETFEETGLILADKGDVGPSNDASWSAFAEMGIAPTLSKLTYVGHAITPAQNPKRFNARFFMAWADEFDGDLGGSGELGNLDWLPVEEALRMPTVDVTQYMLNRMLTLQSQDFSLPDKFPFFTYRRGKRYVRFK